MSHDDIRAALEAATPRPWHAWDRGIGYEVHVGPDCEVTPDARCSELNGEFRETFTGADAHLIAHAPEWLAELLGEVDRLSHWKAEALPVIDGLQELGAELGIRLGKRITGPDALGAVQALTERAEKAEQAIQRVRELHHSTPLTGTWGDCANGDCTHEDPCPEETRDVCAHCVDIFGELECVQIAIPCETIRALDGFLRALDGGERR